MRATLTHVVHVAHSLLREAVKRNVTRSPKWRSVEKQHLKDEPKCAACGGTLILQVHHKVPFHTDPSLELNPSNLITLCMGSFECHLKIGHGGSFKMFNPNVVQDCRTLMRMPQLRSQIEASAQRNRRVNA